MYRTWLWERIQEGGPVAQAIEGLAAQYREAGELTLVCCCAPQACHGDVVKAAVEWILRIGGVTALGGPTTSQRSDRPDPHQ
jgi:hypothetical protein